MHNFADAIKRWNCLWYTAGVVLKSWQKRIIWRHCKPHFGKRNCSIPCRISLHTSQMAHQTGPYPGRDLKYFYSPHPPGPLPCRMGCWSITAKLKFVATHLCTSVERGTVRVKCLVQEHITMSPARARTQTIRSWGVRTNHFKAPYPALPRLTLPYRALQRLTTYKVVEQQTPQTPLSENYKKIIPSTKNQSFAIPKISSGTKYIADTKNLTPAEMSYNAVTNL